MDIQVSESGAVSNPLLDRIRIVRGDITDQKVDAIATLIPEDLEYRGAINHAILAKAGEELDEFVLENIFQPKAGDIYAVPGFDLPCKNILFCIRPKWKNEFERNDRDLLICGRKIMTLAKCMLLDRIAIPLLGSGKNGFPAGRAARLLVQAVEERMTKQMEEIIFVAHDYDTETAFREALTARGWKG